MIDTAGAVLIDSIKSLTITCLLHFGLGDLLVFLIGRRKRITLNNGRTIAIINARRARTTLKCEMA